MIYGCGVGMNGLNMLLLGMGKA